MSEQGCVCTNFTESVCVLCVSVQEAEGVAGVGEEREQLHNKCIIRQPAYCKNQCWSNQQSGSFLVAPVSGQSAPAAMEVTDDEATVDSNTEERGHVINQEPGRTATRLGPLPTCNPHQNWCRWPWVMPWLLRPAKWLQQCITCGRGRQGKIRGSHLC